MLTKFVMCSAIAATLLSGCALADSAASTAVLPRNVAPVIPISYAVAITPNIDSLRLAGTETITLNVTDATDKIQFNSANQKLCHVRFDGKTVETVENSADSRLITIRLKAPVSAGKHRLSFSFVGNIEHDLHGMFVQPYAKRNGAKGQFLTATFEGADVQKIFPSWDQATFPAPVQLSVTVPANWTVWATMSAEQRETHGEFTTISFKPTNELATHVMEFSGGSLVQSSANVVAKSE